MSGCSRPGCRREAKPDDTLCGLHRAGRRRSSAAVKSLVPAAVGRSFRLAAFNEAIEVANLIATNTDDGAERFRQLEGWLREQSAWLVSQQL